MYIYVMRRLLLAIPVLLLSSLVVFGLMRIMPGDALTALMAESGNVSPRELQKLQIRAFSLLFNSAPVGGVTFNSILNSGDIMRTLYHNPLKNKAT
jgi:ABC-type dipeptide/oligopeptide/nickel transport system permease component